MTPTRKIIKGALDRKRYENFAGFLKKQGLIKNTPQLSDFAVELK